MPDYQRQPSAAAILFQRHPLKLAFSHIPQPMIAHRQLEHPKTRPSGEYPVGRPFLKGDLRRRIGLLVTAVVSFLAFAFGLLALLLRLSLVAFDFALLLGLAFFLDQAFGAAFTLGWDFRLGLGPCLDVEGGASSSVASSSGASSSGASSRAILLALRFPFLLCLLLLRMISLFLDALPFLPFPLPLPFLEFRGPFPREMRARRSALNRFWSAGSTTVASITPQPSGLGSGLASSAYTGKDAKHRTQAAMNSMQRCEP